MKTRVLIAEGWPDAGERLASAFRNLNCDVCVVHDANEAIVAAPTFQPHVALLDIAGLDGYEIQVALRKQARATDTYYVAHTAFSDDAVSDLLRTSGFDYRLRKGATTEQLIALLFSSAEWPGALYQPYVVSQSPGRAAPHVR
jgi:DNA-binding response OmpR family regulator